MDPFNYYLKRMTDMEQLKNGAKRLPRNMSKLLGLTHKINIEDLLGVSFTTCITYFGHFYGN